MDSMRRPEMKRKGSGWRWLACTVLFVGGCGAISDIMIDAAKLSAKEALQEATSEFVDEVIDNTVGELLDFEDFEFSSTRESEDK